MSVWSDSHGGIYSIHSLDGCALVYLVRLGADPVSSGPCLLSMPNFPRRAVVSDNEWRLQPASWLVSFQAVRRGVFGFLLSQTRPDHLTGPRDQIRLHGDGLSYLWPLPM